MTLRPTGDLIEVESVEGIVSQLHVGKMVWKVKMLRNERMSEDSLFVDVGFVCCCRWEDVDFCFMRSLLET